MRRVVVALIILLIVLLVAVVFVAKATVIGGTFAGPDGSALNGQIVVRPANNHASINTTVCTGSHIVGYASLSIVSGDLQGAQDVTPSICLLPAKPYVVTFYSGTRQFAWTQWWLPSPTGAVMLPANGNRYMYPTGVYIKVMPATLLPDTSRIGAYVMLSGSYKTATTTVHLTSFESKSVTLTWNVPFANTSYTAACETTASLVIANTISNVTSRSVDVAIANQGGSAVDSTVFCNGRYN